MFGNYTEKETSCIYLYIITLGFVVHFDKQYFQTWKCPIPPQNNRAIRNSENQGYLGTEYIVKQKRSKCLPASFCISFPITKQILLQDNLRKGIN